MASPYHEPIGFHLAGEGRKWGTHPVKICFLSSNEMLSSSSFFATSFPMFYWTFDYEWWDHQAGGHCFSNYRPVGCIFDIVQRKESCLGRRQCSKITWWVLNLRDAGTKGKEKDVWLIFAFLQDEERSSKTFFHRFLLGRILNNVQPGLVACWLMKHFSMAVYMELYSQLVLSLPCAPLWMQDWDSFGIQEMFLMEKQIDCQGLVSHSK